MVSVSSQGKIVVSPRELTFWFAWELTSSWRGMPIGIWDGDPLPITLAWDGLEFL